MSITAVVPQDSNLGPTPCNAMHDGVLKLSLSKGVKIVGFANDVVLLVVGESREKVDVLATDAIDAMEDSMWVDKLAIAHHMLEVLPISNWKAVQQTKIKLHYFQITVTFYLFGYFVLKTVLVTLVAA